MPTIFNPSRIVFSIMLIVCFALSACSFSETPTTAEKTPDTNSLTESSLANLAIVRITGIDVIPTRLYGHREKPLLLINYRVTNLTEQPIFRISGIAHFRTASGQPIVSMPVELDTMIPANASRNAQHPGYLLTSDQKLPQNKISRIPFADMKTEFQLKYVHQN